MLNMSTISSRLARSVIGTCFETLRSLNTVQGVVPALRPRLPSRERSVPSKFAMQGSWKTPVGEYFEFTPGPQAGLTNVFGREVRDDNCRLSPLPVRMLNGRPDPNSISGAKVQSLKNARANPLEPAFPD